MIVTDERLKTRTTQAIALQAQGHFVIDQRQELPLPAHPSIQQIRYSRMPDEYGRFYDYENTWGFFGRSPEDYHLLILRKGTPPRELLPQPRLALATAIVHPGYASIQNNGASFDMDLPSRDQLDTVTLRLINQILQEEGVPLVVWQAEGDDRAGVPIIRIANDSALIFASSAIWSPEDQQLVAAHVVSTNLDLLKAIKATLANSNSKSYLTLKTPDENVYLKGARKGFITAANNLVSANAEGTVTVLLHPWSGDPQTHVADLFYLVVAKNEHLEQRFIERLDLAIPWSLQPEWAKYLLEAGQQAQLVEKLPMSGDDFLIGLRILKNESLWQEVISTGLSQDSIQIT